MIAAGAAAPAAQAADSPQGDSAAAWPITWSPYTYADGTAIRDVTGDENPSDTDLSSGACGSNCTGSHPSVYVAASETGGVTNLFFRFRLKDSPEDWTKGGVRSSTYLVQLAVNGVLKAAVGVDGKDTNVDYVYATNQVGGVGTQVYTTPFDNSGGENSNGLRFVQATDDPATSFMDFQIPLSHVTTASGGAITASTPIQLYYGTSAAASLAVINKDFMGGAVSSVVWTNLAEVTATEANLDVTEELVHVSGPNPPREGRTTVYDLKYTAKNPGLNPVTGITVSSTMGAGTTLVSSSATAGTVTTTGYPNVSWALSSLGAGLSKTATVRLSVTPATGAIGSPITLSGAASGSGTDSVTGDALSDTTAGLSTGNVVDNVAPSATNDDYDVDYEEQLTVTAPGVLSNDSDTETDAFTATLVDDATGDLTLNANGSFTYDPPAGFSGSDDFTYQACDPECSTAATVTLDVEAPPAGIDLTEQLSHVSGPNPPREGRTTVYDLTWTADNTGLTTINTVDVDASLASGVTLVSSSATAGTVDTSAFPDVSWSLASLAGGVDETATVRISVTPGSVDVGSGIPISGAASGGGTEAGTGTPLSDTTTGLSTGAVVDNVAPAATGDGYETYVDEQLTVSAPGVLSNDSDTETDAFTASLVDDATGDLTLNADGSLTYDPPAGFTGSDDFTYQACDPECSTAATVTIDVDPTPGLDLTEQLTHVSGPDPPRSGRTSVYDLTWTATNLGLDAIDAVDVDASLAAASSLVSSSATAGTVDTTAFPDVSWSLASLAGSAGESATVRISVTPDSAAVGSSYPLSGPASGAGTSSVGGGTLDDTTTGLSTGTVVANLVPTAGDDDYGTDFEEQLVVSAPGVLANDDDDEGDGITAQVDDAPLGDVTLNSDGSFTYDPPADFSGEDEFTYTACDSDCSEAATVTIDVAGPPGLDLTEQLTHVSGPNPPRKGRTTVYDLKWTATNSGPFAVDDIAVGVTLHSGTSIVSTSATGGSLSTAAFPDVAWTLDTLAAGQNRSATVRISITPAAGAVGSTLTLAGPASGSGTDADSGGPLSDTTTGLSTGSVVANVVPVGTADSYGTDFGEVLTVGAPGVLRNDDDGEGDALSAVLLSGAEGSLTLNANGSFRYTPPSGFSGADDFRYRACDPDCSAAVTVTVNVGERPEDPIPPCGRWPEHLSTKPVTFGPRKGIRVAIWRTGRVWHMQTATEGERHVFNGRIASAAKVRQPRARANESETDRITRDGDALRFRFRTGRQVDGLDFTIGCSRWVKFRIEVDGEIMETRRILIGARRTAQDNPFRIRSR